MFELERHNQILALLKCLDPEVLSTGHAYFGGGTLLALDLGEYRCSQDVDFICSIVPPGSSGYGYLRRLILDEGYSALFKKSAQMQVGRGTADQYGIRLLVIINNEPIKVEIIVEARFSVDPPRYPVWSPVACLSLSDCFTSKLLANADRFMDDSVQTRDLIDLAVLRLHSVIPPRALEKAEQAYEVIRPLQVAIQRFQERVSYREKCYQGLQIKDSQVPKIIDGLDRLAGDLGLSKTERTFKENHPDFFG